MYSYGSPHMAAQKQDDQHEHTFSSYVRIRDVVLKTYLGRWTMGRSGERGSRISVLPARYDDDDIYIYNMTKYLNIHWTIYRTIAFYILHYTHWPYITLSFSCLHIFWVFFRINGYVACCKTLNTPALILFSIIFEQNASFVRFPVTG